MAILRAIDAGELLAALPDCSVASAYHRTALALLGLAERELAGLYEDVQASWAGERDAKRSLIATRDD